MNERITGWNEAKFSLRTPYFTPKVNRFRQLKDTEHGIRAKQSDKQR